MTEVLDIIKALIEQVPWFASMYIVKKVYDSKANKTLVGIPDKFFIMSER